jgi:hypothetical protein
LPENVTLGGKLDGLQPLNAVFENVGAGLPDAVAWKVPTLPTKKLVELALVIAGAWPVVPEVTGAWPVVPELTGAWLVVPENWESGALTQSVRTS